MYTNVLIKDDELKDKMFLKSKRQQRLQTKAKFTSHQPEEFKVKQAATQGAVSANI